MTFILFENEHLKLCLIYLNAVQIVHSHITASLLGIDRKDAAVLLMYVTVSITGNENGKAQFLPPFRIEVSLVLADRLLRQDI